MADEDPINKYNIDEKKFIVVMVTKGKPIPPAAASTAPSAASASVVLESPEESETKGEKRETTSESKVKFTQIV